MLTRVAAWGSMAVASFALLLYTLSPNTWSPSEPFQLKLAAQSLTPVIAVPAEVRDVSFMAAAVRDPEALRHRPEDDHDATRLTDELKDLRADLSRAQGERAAELHEQAYQRYVSLAYYFEDLTSGALPSRTNRTQAAQSLASTRRLIIQHASAYAKISKDNSRKSVALFHALSAQYLLGQNRQAAIRGMEQLLKSRLSASLKSRARVLIALHQMDRGGHKEAAQRLATAARGLPADAAVATHLAAARAYAGLNGSGKKVRTSHGAYRSQLIQASQVAARLPAAQKDEALRVIVGVWRAAEGHASSWSKAPLKMALHKESLAVKGIIERTAIADWRSGKKSQAIRKYYSLSRDLSGTPIKADVDLRILDLRRVEYLSSKNPKSYEASLLSMGKSYLDPGVLGQGQEVKVQSIQQQISRRHEALVYGEVNRVANRNVHKGERLRAIALADNFLPTLSDDKRIEDMKGRIAGLYALNSQHRDAVRIYKELAETGAAENKRKYLSFAIASQSALATWPATPPWRQLPQGTPVEREELLALYKKYAEAGESKLDWSLLAQIGLLDISLGRAETAFASWRVALKGNTHGPHAAQATGYMLVAYERAKAWGDLEDVARLALGGKMAPSFQGRALAVKPLLGLALIEGGREALGSNNHALAVSKLKEFVAQHQASKRHDEGMYLLAGAYRGNGEHKSSIETLLAFAKRYPSSQYSRDALLQGGDWSGPLAYEDNAMFFYQRFLHRYGRDAEAPRVRDTLATLYLGRGLYAESLAVLREKVQEQGGSAAEKSAVLVQIMILEERHGSTKRAATAADTLIAASDADADGKAQAHALKARQAAQRGDYASVKQIENRLIALGGGSFTSQEALGEVRFLLAAERGKQVVKDYFNLALKDPASTLVQRYEAYKQARGAYQNVCHAGETSYCAPAMHQLGRLSDEFLQSLEDIDVQDTLAKDVVSRFRNFKQSVLNDVAKSSQKADALAVNNVSMGHTDPDATQEVLWQNTSDWSFDRVSGETGNGYVQWSDVTASEAE